MIMSDDPGSESNRFADQRGRASHLLIDETYQIGRKKQKNVTTDRYNPRMMYLRMMFDGLELDCLDLGP
jgi:hypothetical protein